MIVVVSSATVNELAAVKEQIDRQYTGNDPDFKVFFHKSGVGILASVFSLTKLINDLRPDFIIQAGIAGAFNEALALGDTVVVKDEQLGDTGVEEDGNFRDIFDMKLENPNEFPFSNKRLANPSVQLSNYLNLTEVSGVTVNEVSTRVERINNLYRSYGADIETMEGASLHYAGLQTGTLFLQLRSISNYVGERDKRKWKLQPALHNLTTTVLKYIDILYKKPR